MGAAHPAPGELERTSMFTTQVPDECSDGKSSDYVRKLLREVEKNLTKLPDDLIQRFPWLHWKKFGPRPEGLLNKGESCLTAEDIQDHPELQHALAMLVRYPPSKWLLEQEVETLRKIRQRL